MKIEQKSSGKKSGKGKIAKERQQKICSKLTKSKQICTEKSENQAKNQDLQSFVNRILCKKDDFTVKLSEIDGFGNFGKK